MSGAVSFHILMRRLMTEIVPGPVITADFTGSVGSAAADQFLRLYFRARGSETILRRDQVSLRDFAKLLPDISILELKSPTEIAFRLAGSNLAHRIGRDPTGANILDFTPPDMRDGVSFLSWQAVAHPCGHFAVYRVERKFGAHQTFHSVTLPLRASADETVPSQLISFGGAEGSVGFTTPPEPVLTTGELKEFRYVDLGHGVPAS